MIVARNKPPQNLFWAASSMEEVPSRIELLYMVLQTIA